MTPSTPTFEGTADDATLAGTLGPGREAEARPLGRGDEVGRYLLLDRLGQGAVGQVFRAHDPELDRAIAVKVLHEQVGSRPEARERFLQEARAMARIDHPNVLRVYDAGVHRGSVFIAMEIVDGPDLAAWLGGERSRDEVLEVFVGAARGLAAAHAAGVVHRDFKPANVLVDAEGRAKVGDFGLAGMAELDEDDERGLPIGTPAYMSPEHLRGRGIEPRSDQFSFAVALCEGLYGERPFGGDSLVELATNVLAEDLSPSMADRHGRLDGLIRRALRLDPEDRFASMDALITELERIRRPRWPRWLALATVVGVVGGWALWGSEGSPPCPKGEDRVEASWNADAGRRLQVVGSDYTDAHRGEARTQFEQGLDEYASRWVVAFDESCAAVGPRLQRGSSTQKATAQCLDNRLGSFEGMIEHVTATPVDAAALARLIGVLPKLEDCTSGRWVPYPADPQLAVQVEAILQRHQAIKTARFSQHLEGLSDGAEALERDARALGQPYVLARVLTERAQLLAEDGQRESAAAFLDEALRVALEAGHDHLAADVINHVVLVRMYAGMEWSEIRRLFAIAQGLLARSGGDDELMGNLALNMGNFLRHSGRQSDAIEYDRRAQEYFGGASNAKGLARARLNEVVSLIHMERLEEPAERIGDVIVAIERIEGEMAPATCLARLQEVSILSHQGRPREAFARAEQLERRMAAHYTPRAHTRRQVLWMVALLAPNIGREDEAERALSTLGSIGALTPIERVKQHFAVAHLHMYRGRFALAEAELLIGERLAIELENTAHRRAFLIERARGRLVDGHPDDAVALLDVLADGNLTPEQPDGGVELGGALVLWLAGGRDRGHFPSVSQQEDQRVFYTRVLQDAVRALQDAPNPRAVIVRARDRLRERYDDRELMLMTLNAWLDRHPDPSSEPSLP